ncbi:MAG: monofunctional biosynthetic peptidoglycan transglycosylase [Saprospiraceae bacterium]|nr:monofunctional biosynthetic peptidoglycan transglycosylase [Saprospiraceae bacterium]
MLYYKSLNRWKKLLFILVVIIGLHWLYLLLLIFVNPPITTTQFVSLIEGNGISRDYVSMDQISHNAGLAVIAAEDQIFAEHFGLDYESIEKALDYNKKHTKRKRGASTISQQVAKNVFLWQGRSWIRKGLEVYFTFMIELLWSKKRILEMYLNTIEMGRGIFGIEAAAKSYFGKSAKQLNRSESSLIAACLPNPKKFRANAPSSYILNRKEWIMEQVYQIESDPEIIELIKDMKH